MLPRLVPTGASRVPSGQGAVLYLLAQALEQTAGIYNQTARSKVNVQVPDDSSPPRMMLMISTMGYRFEETAEGALVVSEIDEHSTRAWARIEPQADSTGRIVCWRERKVAQPVVPTLRSADSLSEQYLLSLVRRRLVPQ